VNASPGSDSPSSSRVEVVALPTEHRFRPGDDLAEALLDAVSAAGVSLQDGDVVCVASKVVSLAEGQLVPIPAVDDPKDARRAVAREHAAEIVAESPWVLVTRTQHGFVAANGGVDASNLGVDEALLLPEDPDASAAQLRQALAERVGTEVGIVVTDTFGRPWRLGQTDVALGVAGTAAIRDERGAADLHGRPLEVTEAAVADEVAGAADLVRTKASGTPFVLVRGLPRGEEGVGADLVRPLEQDLFAVGGPNAAERSIAARRTVRGFALDRSVPREVLERAVAAAVTAPAPHHTKPWRFLRVQRTTRTGLLDAMAQRWHADLVSDGVDPQVIERRIATSDRILRAAPELLVPFVTLDGAHEYPDERRSVAERDMFLLSGGAALANLQIVLAAHGVGAAWISSTLFCPSTVRASLELPGTWQPLGMIAIGYPAEPPQPRGTIPVDDFLLER
jgi:coenzyme F420-0:L-glutamate ligase / coenzyme F420-1:gamma-L-glutamate ligase